MSKSILKKSSSKVKYLLVSILVLFIFSCKTQKEANKVKNRASKSELLAEKMLDSIQNNSIEFKTLLAKFDAVMKTPKGEMATKATLKIMKDSMIIVSVTPLLGIELMRTRITKTELVVLNRINKTYYLEGMENINKLFGVNLTYNHIESILLNKIFTYPDSLQINSDYTYYEKPKDSVVFSAFTYKGKADSLNYHHTVWLDNSDKKYSSFTVNLPKTKRYLEVNYKNFKQVENFSYPFLVEITTKDKDYESKLTINTLKVELNKDLNFAFSISKRYKKQEMIRF